MPRRILTLAATWTLAALAGCSAVGALNATAPHRAFTATDDLAYGSAPRQRLDVYVPTQPAPTDSGAGRPVVVFVYGGSWQNGARGDYLFVGAALASRGFVTVIPDYRVWPQTRFPGFVDDAAAAVRWAKDHARDFGGDPSRLYLMGHSAGAQIVGLLATDGRYLAAERMSKRDIAGMIGLAGPYDFLPLQDDTLKQIFPASTRAASQPINFVDGDEPPMFLAAGTGDTTVDPGNTDRFTAKLRAAGDTVEVRHYPRIGHALTVGAIAGPLRFFAPVLKDTVQFMRHTPARRTAASTAVKRAATPADASASSSVAQ